MSVHGTMQSADASTLELTAEDRQTLLRIARQALEDYLGSGKPPQCQSDSAALSQPGATFVTLRRRGSGELRGCRGEPLAQRPLIESVAHMAIAAATDDLRFPPATIDEAPSLRIEINVLTPMKPIKPTEVVVGRHGLMIVKGTYRGLLLPEVPVRYSWGREAFLSALCRKAGLPETAWQTQDAQLYCFETEVWGER